ncbi:glycoside hydrolase family 16 protein [Qipengyuania sp. DSG2-2]|uniref:glycoside hydrolase family 16 protein n=1 Tax=Qipengyuania sp. DGS2-2 TaxID=3349631 RepID=UPI0036D36B65
MAAIRNSITTVCASLLLAACGSTSEAPASTKSEVINEGSLGAEDSGPDSQSGWDLVWSDEFDGNAIDDGKWSFNIDCWGGGNEERQCYTDRAENASLEDGKLVITARKEEYSGPALPPHMREGADDPDAQATKPFTSARLVTQGNAAWQYGRIEVRAKLPQGQGTWPAIWMLPEDEAYGTWAASGEIDIMEAVNLGVPCEECPNGQESTILGTLHFGGLWPDNSLNSTEISYPAVLDGFHTFGIVWQPGRMVWTVDGRVFAEKRSEDWFTTATDEANAPFDKPFHLILNLAIGGGLPEKRGLMGVSEEGFPKRMEVDWVRVWECNSQADEPGSCAWTGD